MTAAPGEKRIRERCEMDEVKTTFGVIVGKERSFLKKVFPSVIHF